MFKKKGYVAGLSILVIAIAVFVNLIIKQLPSNIREFDMTDNNLYTVSDTSVQYLKNLDKDVDIIVLAEDASVDARIKKFIANYAALSSHLKVQYIDPVAHPSALTDYNAEKNTVVVKCAATNKTAKISFSQIIQYEMNYQNYSMEESAFDAEGQLTSAIDQVTRATTSKLYLTTNHGEASFGKTVSDAFTKQSLTTESLSLLMKNSIPDDCSMLVINGPTSDFADDEIKMLSDYMDKGGQIMIIMASDLNKLEKLDKFMADYGLQIADGYIADNDRYYQQFQTNFAIAPTTNGDTPITAKFGEKDLSLIYQSRGFTSVTPLHTNVKVTTLMNTSENSAAVTSDTNQTKGQYILAAFAENSDSKGRLYVIGSQSFIEEDILSRFGNLVNLQIFMNMITANMKDVSSIAIPSKSLAESYNTVQHAGLWSALLIGVIPFLILVYGFLYWMERRKS